MKKLLPLTIAALSGLAAPLAQAWTYNDGDVLLVFRNAANPVNDVEYDIGSVSQFLGKTNGYTTRITNWNLSLAQGVFGADLTGVSVALLAVTSATNSSPTAWVSGIEPNTTAYNDNLSDWNYNYYGTISAIGYKPLNLSVPTSGTNAYSINPFGKYKPAAYSYIVSRGTYNGVAQLGGGTPFIVEQTIPGTLDFWAVQPLETGAGSPPDKQVGTFSVTADGVLTFTAGPSPATISGITRSNNVSKVTFNTVVGNTYKLTGSNQLGATGAWPVVGSSLTGDGSSHFLTDTNPASAGFYRVTAQ